MQALGNLFASGTVGHVRKHFPFSGRKDCQSVLGAVRILLVEQ
jgi:hypothetical protein